jgi:hypothetical protein
MKKNYGDYEIVPFQKMRHAIIDYLHEARRKHMIYALAEVDVTKARQIIREHKARTGESFTASLCRKTLLVGIWQVPTLEEENWWYGNSNSHRDVRGRRRLGDPHNRLYARHYSGRHCRETGGR